MMRCSHGCVTSMGVGDGVPIVCPFWPGADYGRLEYPDGCVVVDNPPFSILAKVIRFYQAHGVRFFLFAPGLTLFSVMVPGVTCIAADLNVTYANGAPKETHEHELETAERLRANVVRCMFQIDREYVKGDDGRLVDRGPADLAGGTELKSLHACSSKNTVFSHMKNASRKRDAIRAVFDNFRNRGMPDDELAECLRHAQAFKRGTVYVINSDGIMVRIK